MLQRLQHDIHCADALAERGVRLDQFLAHPGPLSPLTTENEINQGATRRLRSGRNHSELAVLGNCICFVRQSIASHGSGVGYVGNQVGILLNKLLMAVDLFLQ